MSVDIAKLNEALFEAPSTPSLAKQAQDAVCEFTRTQVRADSFYRRILPPILITNDELDQWIDTDKPVKIIDKGCPYKPFVVPNVPAAALVGGVDAPVAIIVDGDEVLYLPGECNPLSIRRPRTITI